MHDDDDDVDDLEIVEDSSNNIDDLEFIEDSSDAEAEALSDDNADGLGVATYVVRVGIALALIAGVIGIAVGVFPNVNKQLGIDDEGAVIDFKPGDPLPDPPLQLAEPAAPAPRMDEVDLAEIEPGTLRYWANHYAANGFVQAAIQCQHMSVVKSEIGHYDLACFYARAGNVNAAFYWLQLGARDEGANAEWAIRDSDLVTVRNDPRWRKLLVYLKIYERHWETSVIRQISLVLPRDALPGQRLPLFIGLHGMGDTAQNFVNPGEYQAIADEMGAAFIAVSGTRARGRQNFMWSGDPDMDLAHIDGALRDATDRLTPAEGQVVLFGFSQGGRLSAELALRHPDRFAGAIVMSPGSFIELKSKSTDPNSNRRRQGLVAVCGAGEHPLAAQEARRYAATFEKLGARVYLKVYPEMNTHTFPPDYWEKMPIWGRFILDPEAPVPTP